MPTPTLRDYLKAQCHKPEMQARLQELFDLPDEWRILCGQGHDAVMWDLADELESILGGKLDEN